MLPLMLIAIALAAGAQAAPAASKPLSSYCSSTGDLCFGVIRKNGAIHLDLTTVARYFDRYRLCVRPPDGSQTCRSLPIQRRGAIYASSVRWYRNYPNSGPGKYVVTWKLAAPLGPSLTFRLS